MEPQNPIYFEPGAAVESVYSGKKYIVVVPDKRGMATLQNEAGNLLPFNSCANRHFIRTTMQLQLTF